MVPFFNPARQAFVAEIGKEFVMAQVLIRRDGTGFEFRHIRDRSVDAEKLRLLKEDEIRPLAQTTSSGQFRPLKSAPNLRSGWKFIATNESQVESALNQLYPDAIPEMEVGEVREADFDSPSNPRRRRFELERLEIRREGADVVETD